MNIGYHIPFNGFSGSLEEAKRLGLDTFQMFIRNNRNCKQRNILDVDVNYFNSHLYGYGITSFVVHAPYTINPASGDNDLRQRSITLLKKDLELLQKFNGYKYMVVHPGSATTYPREDCMYNLLLTVRELLPYTKGTKLCIETMAGQGSELMSCWEDFDKYFAAFRDVPDVSICLDTCHLFGAGLEFNKVLDYFTENGLEKQVGVLHLNGSQYPFGSHRDRHGTLQSGYIPLEVNIANAKAFAEKFPNAPIILETEEATIHDDWLLVKNS